MAKSCGQVTLDPGLSLQSQGGAQAERHLCPLCSAGGRQGGACRGGMFGWWVGARELVGDRDLWRRQQRLGGWQVTELSLS